MQRFTVNALYPIISRTFAKKGSSPLSKIHVDLRFTSKTTLDDISRTQFNRAYSKGAKSTRIYPSHTHTVSGYSTTSSKERPFRVCTNWYWENCCLCHPDFTIATPARTT